jgi:3-phenylpropionate/trans-cinnamate dioxygenase ferredoxin subunit
MARHVVCYADELLPGDRRIVEFEGRSIGVFNVNGAFHAVRNRCPHKGAPLCKGLIKSLVTATQPYEYDVSRDGEILRCPWHGWEFDLLTGKSVFNPHRLRVKSYNVSVEEWPYDFACPGDDPDEDPSLERFDVSVEHDQAKERQIVVLNV